jgi:ferredoxin--NADP+ reductase
VVAEPGAVRVAVVGAGPAGAFLAEALLRATAPRFEVDLIDRLPTPWGLLRGGVAPDHARIKSVARRFEATAAHERCRLLGNVEIGRDVTHGELLDWYHAVVYTTGCATDRRLGIPGEDLPGSVAATDFVAWYNGHPDHAAQAFDLSGERAVIVGNGNVALDCARMLLLDQAALAQTDIADHALAALGASAIREVVVLGRRGPQQASFTNPELLELAALDVDVHVSADDLRVPLPLRDLAPSGTGIRNQKILRGYARTPPAGRERRLVFRFFASPVEIVGEERVTGVRVARNALERHPDGRSLIARATDAVDTLDASLVLRAVGYRGAPVAGLPFDAHSGLLANMGGRVTGAPRTYTAGWIKRGPSGVIGTNKRCANETAAFVVADAAAGRLAGGGALDADAVLAALGDRGARVVDHAGWRAIDAAERSAGAAHGRPRVKLTDVEGLLGAARA